MRQTLSLMVKGVRGIGRAFGVAGRATVALVGICGVVAALANYTMTQGAGTNFGSIVVSTVHYAQMLMCDPTTPGNCGAVKAGNSAATTDVAQVVTDPNVLAAVLGTGSVTSVDYTTTSPGTSAPLGVPVQGMTGGVPIASPDAGNYAGGSGSGTCAAACNATTLWSLDTSNYSEVSAQTTSAGVATVTIQKSNDNATWLTAQCYTTGGAGTGTTNAVVTTTAALGEVTCPVTARFMRGQFTAYTSGTRTDFWVARRYQTVPISTVFIGNGTTASVPTTTSNEVPNNATMLSGNAAGTTGAVVGTLTGAASLTTRICGFNVSAIGGTAAVGPIVVAGITGSSQTYQGSASAAGGIVAQQNFSPCIPASGTNTAITVTTTADGTATAVNVNAWGFR